MGSVIVTWQSLERGGSGLEQSEGAGKWIEGTLSLYTHRRGAISRSWRKGDAASCILASLLLWLNPDGI